MHHKQSPIILLGSVILGMICSPLGAESLGGAYNPTPRPAATPRLLSADGQAAPRPALEIELPPVSPQELDAMRQRRSRSKAHMIGFGRPLPAPFRDDVLSGLRWNEHEDGSKSALVSIRSPGAVALRAELDLSRIPPGLGFRYFALSAPGPSPQVISYDTGPAGAMARQARPAEQGARHLVWTPLTAGDNLGIEVHVPASIDPEELALPVPRVSHITEFPLFAPTTKDASGLDNSSSCQIDVACRNSPTWNTVKDAVAKLTFVNEGFSFLCTGTLLIDQEEGSWIPYVLTADHCINTPAAAASLNSFWFFQRSICGGPVDLGTQLSAGAWLLDSGDFSDFSLLELAEPAPGGALFAGSNTATSVFQPVSGIHHPSGDVKMIAFGSITGASNCREAGNCGFNDIEVLWSEGHTEGGSSGSGIFNPSGQLVGTLWGGSSSCGAQNEVFGVDAYGRFADTLPRVERFLNRSAESLTLGWSVAGEVKQESWRDYRLDIGDSIYSIEVILHQLGADADLYVRKGSKPVLNLFDCAHRHQGRDAEFCSLAVIPGEVVYIGLFGSNPTGFQLTTNGSWIGKELAYAVGRQPPLIALLQEKTR